MVLPPYMICIGKNSPESETTNVKVMFRLSVRPFMGTDFSPLSVIVNFPTYI